MILSDRDILELLEKGKIKIEPFEISQLGPASVDLSLSNRWWRFKKGFKKIDLEKPWEHYMESFVADKVEIKPKELILGITQEKITLPDDIMGFLEGRSRFARIGLSVHITSSLLHPGVDNHQVLEIMNNSPYPIVLKKGLRISQLVLIKLNSPTTKPYKKFGKIAVKQ